MLNSQPTADVTVNFASNDSSEGAVSPTSLTFTSVNWNAPQVATVTGADDALADGDQTYAIAFSATTSADGNHAAIRPSNVTVLNIDNETAGITVSAVSGFTEPSVLRARAAGDEALDRDAGRQCASSTATRCADLDRDAVR